MLFGSGEIGQGFDCVGPDTDAKATTANPLSAHDTIDDLKSDRDSHRTETREAAQIIEHERAQKDAQVKRAEDANAKLTFGQSTKGRSKKSQSSQSKQGAQVRRSQSDQS